jgi:hypothetical protein
VGRVPLKFMKIWFFSFSCIVILTPLLPRFHSCINFGLMQCLTLTLYYLLSESFWHNFPVQSTARSLQAWRSQTYHFIMIACTMLYLSCFMSFDISSSCLHIDTDGRNFMFSHTSVLFVKLFFYNWSCNW